MFTIFPCFIYNGIDKIPGLVQLMEKSWIFTVSGFENTNLNIIQNFKDIQKIQYFKLFNLEVCGLKITDIYGKEAVLILESYKELYNALKLATGVLLIQFTND